MQAGGKFGMVTMDQHLAHARERRARSRSRPRSSGARTRKTSAGSIQQPQLGGLMPTTFAYKVRDQGGKLVEGQLEADDASARRRQAAPDGLHAHRDRGEARRSSSRPTSRSPGSRRPGQAEGRRGLLAPVRDDDQLRSLADPRRSRSSPSRPRTRSSRKVVGEVRLDVEQGVVALGRDLEAPEGVQPPLHRDGHAPVRSAVCSTRC